MTQEQWQALKNHDASMDGKLYCGLLSSKTVCRPSCTYRARDIRNVAAFSSLEEALSQGFKPCSHCRPDRLHWHGPKQELVRAAKEYLEAHSAEKFSLEALSSALFINGCYLLRTFKAATGQTLLEYHHQVRCEKAKELLTQNELSIAAVGDRAGFASAAHFSRIFKKTVGVTPTQYRSAYWEQLDAAPARPMDIYLL